MALNKTMKMATTSAVALGLATVASSDAMAQSETVNATVSATVQNAFDLTQTTAMNFGTLAAFADTAGTKTASISVTTAGALGAPTNNAPAQFVVVDNALVSQGVFDVANAAPTAGVTITFANTTDLSCGACVGAPPVLTLSGLGHDQGGSPTTSATGTMTINVGATITTVAGGNQYEDGSYAGGFDMTVAY